MTPNPDIMQAVERLDYRVTVGDVAAQAGLKVAVAEQGLLALASQVNGHLQVAESGDVVYLFPQEFRSILRNKYFRLQLREWWEKIWRILFYLIRISFGILLVASILLIFLSILLITISLSAASNSDNDSDNRIGMPSIGFGPDIWWIFYPDYSSRRATQRPSSGGEKSELNFLEAIFSFLFGDGNPNADLEDHRWKSIATTIRNQKGAVVAEQLAPYLDEVGQGYAREYEEYMLPVLTRFNGRPEVSPEGGLVYHFPELQTSAIEQRLQPIAAYLRELPWRFSQASGGQIALAIGLGSLNLVGALALGNLLAGGVVAAQMGGLVAFVQAIFWVLLGYGSAFLAIPLLRYFWIQWRNRKVESRNQSRQDRAVFLNEADQDLQKKILYAQQFAAETIVGTDNLAYTTEQDLIEQEIEQTDKIDAEWQRRLEQG
ncbi:MAG: hypothetical protein DCF22_05370 [Leptolyngbya sp.]|nr:MAG: hypothetical protein DCF22_05370 [Leptolyngbya sp.]